MLHIGGTQCKLLNKEYIWWMDECKCTNMKSMLCSKGNHNQNKKTTYRMEENICKWWDWQGLNFQNVHTAHTSQQQKNKWSNQKMGSRPK